VTRPARQSGTGRSRDRSATGGRDGHIDIDPELERDIRAQREAAGTERFDEVWDGVYVIATLPDNEHQAIIGTLAAVIQVVVGWESGVRVRAGVNISDRVENWEHNYRWPDVAVFMPHTTARNLETHWLGGPDLAVEVASRNEMVRDKLPFYSKVNTRELLIVDRFPWSLELFRLRDGQLRPVQRSAPGQPASLASEILPLAFSLRDVTPRPQLVVTHRETGQTWTA
jgi:Uma2 family endonuclease